MTIYGYVKTTALSVTAQLKKLEAYSCDEIYIEEEAVKGNVMETLLGNLNSGDTIVVESLQVLEKTLKELKGLFRFLSDKEVRLISVSDQFDSSKPVLGYEVLDVLIRNETAVRGQLVRRQLALSKSLGITLGRPAIGQETVADIERLHVTQKLSMREIADICDVSLGTVHKYVKQLQTT